MSEVPLGIARAVQAARLQFAYSNLPLSLVISVLLAAMTASMLRGAGTGPTLLSNLDIPELRRLERVKSEFVSIISHELRTPLTSIRGSLGLLVNDTTGTLPNGARDLLSVADRNAARLGSLIEDLLDVEKLEAGKLRLQLQSQPLRPLIERTVANGLRVAVRDRGSGISPQFRPHLFTKFSQCDASDSRPQGGTGLGLAISKALIEQMGGRIGFEAAADQGTIFFFELPAWLAGS